MNTPSALLLTVSLCAFTPFSAAAAQEAHAARGCPPATVAQIEAQFSRFSAAWATGDPDQVTALFTADPVLLATVSNRPRTTPAAVRDYFVGFLDNRPVARLDTSTVEIDCDTASRVGTWTVTLTDPASGAVRVVPARYSFLYRFEAGDWKIDHLHSSAMPEAIATPAP